MDGRRDGETKHELRTWKFKKGLSNLASVRSSRVEQDLGMPPTMGIVLGYEFRIEIILVTVRMRLLA